MRQARKDKLSDAERIDRGRASRKRTYEKHRDARLATAALWKARQCPQKEKDARRVRYEVRRSEVLVLSAEYRRANPALYRAAAAKRRAAKFNATPAWASLDRIAAIYEAAALLTEFMGAPYEVDHIVPLQSKFVCGLHCEANLQIIPRRDNRSKANTSWPDR